MRLACDENVRRSFYNVLRQDGHDVVWTREELAPSATDEAVAEFCRSTDRVLVTNDDDFFEFDAIPGVLFLTGQTVPARRVATAVRHIDEHVDPGELAGTVLHVPDGWA